MDDDDRDLMNDMYEYRAYKMMEQQLQMCHLPSKFPSLVRRINAENDNEIINGPIFPGKLRLRYIRNTNATGVYTR